jgi:hypothetical protein
MVDAFNYNCTGQWENEIKRRCKRNALSVISYHGQDRHKMAPTLHKYGVVITTYQVNDCYTLI